MGRSDAAFVDGKYRDAFSAVLPKAEKLFLSEMAWVTEKEWTKFAHRVLPLCTSLEVLSLHTNPNLAMDIELLVAILPTTLKVLDIEQTKCFGDATKADWARLPALEEVWLSGTKIMNPIGTVEQIVAADCTAHFMCI